MNAQESHSLSSLIRRPVYAGRFRDVLHDRTDQFVSSLLQVGATMPDVEPKSIIAAAMTAAALDLPINKNLGFAWIIPFMDNRRGRKLAQFQIGYKGYIQLALRTQQYSRLNSRAVNKEAFTAWDDMGQPIIDWGALDPLLPAWGYWFGFDLIPNTRQRFLWTKYRIEAHAAKYSQAFRSKSGPWITDFDAMALKTVIANELRHWGVLSIHMEKAFRVDSAVHTDPDEEPEYLDNSDEPKEVASSSEASGQASGGEKPRPETARTEASVNLGAGHAGPVSGEQSPSCAATEPAPSQSAAGDVSKPKKEPAVSYVVDLADAPAATPRKRKALNPQAEILLPGEPAKPDAAETPQETLAKQAGEHGVAFEMFRKWIMRNQFPINNIDSIGQWSELPTKMVSLWLRAGQLLWNEVCK